MKYTYGQISRLLYPMIIGFIVSSQCKMGKDSGKSIKFRPPGYIFGIVWPILYLLMSISAYRNFDSIARLFFIQLLRDH